MEALRRATTRRKRGANKTSEQPNDGARLDVLVHGAPRGLRLVGDVGALDTLDVGELARIARRRAA
ncbi:MAG: hypothetical protein JNK05_17830 [Myxococcales bacterium]|nr:hypothetical protein [Myxococcales bacterium]